MTDDMVGEILAGLERRIEPPRDFSERLLGSLVQEHRRGRVVRSAMRLLRPGVLVPIASAAALIVAYMALRPTNAERVTTKPAAPVSTTTPTTSTTTTIAGVRVVTVTDSNVPSDATGPLDVGSDATVAPRNGSTAASSPPAPADDSYPPAADCSVDSRDMAPGQSKYCRFTATAYGGWWAGFAGTGVSKGVNDPMLTAEPNCCPSVSSAAVWVTRAGTQHYYWSDGGGSYSSSTGCDNNIIQPGDLVEIKITLGKGTYNSPTSYYEAAAGSGWDCENHNP